MTLFISLRRAALVATSQDSLMSEWNLSITRINHGWAGRAAVVLCYLSAS